MNMEKIIRLQIIGIQSSINGMTSEEAINQLQEVVDNIESAVDILNEVILL